MPTNFIERLQYFMAQNDINDNKLTVDAGLSVGLIGKAKKSGKAMNSANIEKILLAYPDLNSEWLLTGKGDMLKTKGLKESNPYHHPTFTPDKGTEKKLNIQEISIETRPRIPLEAAAGSLSIALSSATNDECEQIPIIPTFPRYDFSIVTRGDSMMPEFQSGDELACAFIRESTFIQWGRAHILDTAQGVILKKIFDNKSSILCRSINPDYPDFEVPKNEIYHIAIVVGLIRHF